MWTSAPAPMHRHAAYRRRLCVECQQVPPAAGMPRCYPCHAAYTGTRLTPSQARAAKIRAMTGPRPSVEVRALAYYLERFVAVVSEATAT